MAEQVQAVMESMIPVFEDLKLHSIFTEDEVADFIRYRRDFEYRLKRRISEKEDYLRYIDYELSMEFKRRQRVQAMNEQHKEHAKKPSISDHAGVRHIHYIFKRALRKFHGDISLWLTFIDFCKHFQSYKTLEKVFAQSLRHHPLVEGFWILAASWEYNYHGNAAAARTLFQRGIRLIPESALLWSQYFLLELAVLAQPEIPGIVLENARKSLKAAGPWVVQFLEAYQTSKADLPDLHQVLEGLVAEFRSPETKSIEIISPLEAFRAEVLACRSEEEYLRLEPRMSELYHLVIQDTVSTAMQNYEYFLRQYSRFQSLDVIYQRLSIRILPSTKNVPVYLRLLSDSRPASPQNQKLEEKLHEWMVAQEPRESSHWLSYIKFVHVCTKGLQPKKVLQLHQRAIQSLGHASANFSLQYQKIIQ